ncbi:hypothetical protein [Rhodococcus sp. IEGM1428]|uniref:hypothetical protein n=1 Tax=Rhodococcus sp. IEGM1428 TaxID=3392191 RepID=UPI003D0FD91E
MRLGANDIYGGVIGTVLASVTLAAIPIGQTPGYSAVWIMVSVAIAALTRSYGQHVSTHHVGPGSGFWRDLGKHLLTGVPMLIACIPTLVALLVAHLTGWNDDVVQSDGSIVAGYTTVVLGMNAALLFAWGVVAGRISGYSTIGSCAVGLGNTALGVAVIVTNVLIR